MLHELLAQKKETLNHFFDTLDLNHTDHILKTCLECKGTLFFSGIGKSGLAAKKIAATMVSTGTKALFLSPIDALHGDIGLVSSNDIFFLLSRSGETEELLNLVPSLKNKGALLIAMVSNPKSRLAKACHESISLPLLKELCPFDLAPTTSTVTQLIFGDLLTIGLMRLKNFSLEDYGKNHPSGRIGKRILLKVKDLMLTGEKIPHCRPQDLLVDTLVELSNKQCGCVLVLSPDSTLMGIFTDGDLRRALQLKGADSLQMPMELLMTKTPRYIHNEVSAWEAMKTMESDPQRPITVLPVLDDQRKVVGVIKLHDIIQSGI